MAVLVRSKKDKLPFIFNLNRLKTASLDSRTTVFNLGNNLHQGDETHLQCDEGSPLEVKKGHATFHLHERLSVSRSDGPCHCHFSINASCSAQLDGGCAVIRRAVLPWFTNEHAPRLRHDRDRSTGSRVGQDDDRRISLCQAVTMIGRVNNDNGL